MLCDDLTRHHYVTFASKTKLKQLNYLLYRIWSRVKYITFPFQQKAKLLN